MKKTKLLLVRDPYPKEEEKGAEIVFIRGDENGNKYLIYGRKVYESWEQWGTWEEILWDNMDAIDLWRRNRLLRSAQFGTWGGSFPPLCSNIK